MTDPNTRCANCGGPFAAHGSAICVCAMPDGVPCGCTLALFSPALEDDGAVQLCGPVQVVGEQKPEGTIRIFGDAEISALEAGFQREIQESRGTMGHAPVVSAWPGFMVGGGCCGDCSGLEVEPETVEGLFWSGVNEARVRAMVESLDAAASSDHVTPGAKDRARAAAAALRWVLDADAPSPADTVF